MNESIEIINAKTSFTVPRSDAVVARPSDGARLHPSDGREVSRAGGWATTGEV